MFCSIVHDVDVMLELATGCRASDKAEDEKGGEFSSSEESAGVAVWVKRGAGLFRKDWEKPLLCFMVGEVRKGSLHCYSLGQRKGHPSQRRTIYLCDAMKLLTIILIVFASALS